MAHLRRGSERWERETSRTARGGGASGSKRDASACHVIVVDFRGRFTNCYQNRCLRRRTLLSYILSSGYLCCIRDKDDTATYATIVS